MLCYANVIMLPKCSTLTHLNYGNVTTLNSFMVM